MTLRRLAAAACASMLLACPADVGRRKPDADKLGDAKKADAKKADAKAPDAKAPDAKSPDAKAPDAKAPDAKAPDAKAPDAKAPDVEAPTAAKLLPGAPLPITDLLGKAPPDAQTKLGEPTGKGMSRTSCVRFVPDKIWFECSYAHQRYADTTGTYTAVQMSYEDGKAASIAFEGVRGEGAFDPRAALANVGLQLPGEPQELTPKEGVKLWSWFNSDARLVLDGLQYRVEVSTVDDKWEHSKVEVILNHPLDAAQQAKVKQVRGKAAKGG